MAYCTPLAITVSGQDQLVSPGGDQVVGYVPATGEEIWRFRYDGYSVVPRPVFGHGLVFVSSAYDTPVLYAIRLPGTGDITETAAAWSMRRGAPNNPSPVLVGDELYIVSDLGIATCVDAKTGEQHWQKRLGGGFSASLLEAEGHIYFTNEEGLTTVMAADKNQTILAENQVEGRHARFACHSRQGDLPAHRQGALPNRSPINRSSVGATDYSASRSSSWRSILKSDCKASATTSTR